MNPVQPLAPTSLSRDNILQRKTVNYELLMLNSFISSIRRIGKDIISLPDTPPKLNKEGLPEPIRSAFEAEYQEIINNPPKNKEDIGRHKLCIKKKIPPMIYAHHLGVKILTYEFSFSFEDLNRAGASFPGEMKSEPQNDCCSFVFYHQHDVPALEKIFKDGGLYFDYIKSNYTSVAEPEPGDVVAYIKSNNLATCRHYGICIGDGKALSQFGTGGPIVAHGLEQIPKAYGSSVLFFRKKDRFPFTRKIWVYLESVETLGDKHPLSAAPSTEKAREIFLDFFKKFKNEQKEKLLIHSFYGVRTVKPLYKAIKKSVIALEISEALTKRQLLIDLKQLSNAPQMLYL